VGTVGYQEKNTMVIQSPAPVAKALIGIRRRRNEINKRTSLERIK